MISIAKKDRDVLRFLWYGDAFGDQQDLMELRFTRVVFGVSSSPFLLNATIWHHLEKYEATHPSLIQKLQRSLYVDNVVCGAEDEEQAYQMFMESKKILEEAGFNLRKFYPIPQHCKLGSILMPAKRTTFMRQTLTDSSRRHTRAQLLEEGKGCNLVSRRSLGYNRTRLQTSVQSTLMRSPQLRGHLLQRSGPS